MESVIFRREPRNEAARSPIVKRAWEQDYNKPNIR